MLGTALREALTARGGTVLQLVRHSPQAPNHLQWDPSGEQELHLPGIPGAIGAAIHLSGANLADRRWSKAYKRELVESRIVSTRVLACALAELKTPPKVLLLASAVGIYGNRGNELLDETSQPGDGFLADLCREWEAAAEPARAAGIRVVHLRFGMVLGSGKGSLARVLPFFRMGLGGQIGDGSQFMSWISLPDAVGAAIFLLNKPDANGPFNFSAPNPVTNAQFTHMLATQLHRTAFFTVPAFVARLAFGEMAREVLLASTRAYPARLTAAGYQFAHPSLVHALSSILTPHSR